MKWRLITSGALCGSDNMALDEALLESVARGDSLPVLRLYRWTPSTVTLGYAQSLTDGVNLSACRELGLDVVRRCTGGRAVLHANEVTYAVIAPESGSIFPEDILGTYRIIAAALQATVAVFGLRADLAPGRERGARPDRPNACFVAPSSYELVCEGRKLTGSAQKRNGAAFLQHGSLPLEFDPLLLSRALHASDHNHEAATDLFLRKVGWLNRWLEQPVSIAQVESALVGAFRETLGVELIDDQPTASEHERMKELAATRYRSLVPPE